MTTKEAENSDGYKKLQKVLDETPVGNAFRTVHSNQDDGDIIWAFIRNNGGELIYNDVHLQLGWSCKWDIKGKVLFVTMNVNVFNSN